MVFQAAVPVARLQALPAFFEAALAQLEIGQIELRLGKGWVQRQRLAQQLLGFGLALQADAEHAQVGPGRGRFGAAGNGLAVAVFSLAGAILSRQQRAQIQMRVRTSRGDGERATVAGFGLRKFLLLIESEGQVGPGFEEIGGEVKCAAK